jgi:hypothetical protein
MQSTGLKACGGQARDLEAVEEQSQRGTSRPRRWSLCHHRWATLRESRGRGETMGARVSGGDALWILSR